MFGIVAPDTVIPTDRRCRPRSPHRHSRRLPAQWQVRARKLARRARQDPTSPSRRPPGWFAWPSPLFAGRRAMVMGLRWRSKAGEKRSQSIVNADCLPAPRFGAGASVNRAERQIESATTNIGTLGNRVLPEMLHLPSHDQQRAML